jgi:hypothetical protein
MVNTQLGGDSAVGLFWIVFNGLASTNALGDIIDATVAGRIGFRAAAVQTMRCIDWRISGVSSLIGNLPMLRRAWPGDGEARERSDDRRSAR